MRIYNVFNSPKVSVVYNAHSSECTVHVRYILIYLHKRNYIFIICSVLSQCSSEQSTYTHWSVTNARILCVGIGSNQHSSDNFAWWSWMNTIHKSNQKFFQRREPKPLEILWQLIQTESREWYRTSIGYNSNWIPFVAKVLNMLNYFQNIKIC